jgi:hypothetical protein
LKWNKHKKPLIITFGVILSLAGVHSLIFSPLYSEIDRNKEKLSQVRLEIKHIIEETNALSVPKYKFYKSTHNAKSIIKEVIQRIGVEDISIMALNERPATPIELESQQLRVIHLEIESTYQTLGKLLGMFKSENLGVLLVNKFDIRPSVDNQNIIHANLVLHIHVRDF